MISCSHGAAVASGTDSSSSERSTPRQSEAATTAADQSSVVATALWIPSHGLQRWIGPPGTMRRKVAEGASVLAATAALPTR